jgi:hypothetical protein
VTLTHPAFATLPMIASIGDEDAARVETTTLLPGGGLVTLTVRAVAEGYMVSDDGAGRMTMLALGVQDLTRGDTRRGNELAEAHGLVFDGQGFSASEVSTDRLPAAIAYVADACRAWAAGAIEARARRTERDLAERTIERLRAALPAARIETGRSLLGASTKRHEFDIVVTLPHERFAVFEMLTPAAVSMASVHMKFYDLLQAHADWPREAVVEDLSVWSSEDLAVMQQVASHVRGFESSWADLGRLGA